MFSLLLPSSEWGELLADDRSEEEGWDFWEGVDLVEVGVADLVGVEVVDLGVGMVVCFVVREEKEAAGEEASQGLSRLKSQVL